MHKGVAFWVEDMKSFTERDIISRNKNTEKLLGFRGCFVRASGIGTLFGDDCYTRVNTIKS